MQSLEYYLLIVGRSAAVYTVIIIAFRLAGKKHVAQLSLIDFILILLVSNAVQNAMVGEDTSVEGGIIAGLTLVAMNIILTKLIVKSERIAKIVEGEPVLLVRHGKMLTSQLKLENIRIEEVYEAMHRAGVARLEDVSLAILETDGAISIIKQDVKHEQAA